MESLLESIQPIILSFCALTFLPFGESGQPILEEAVRLQLVSDVPVGVFLWGSQAQRRRWLKTRLYTVPGSPILLFFYRYFLRGGWMDGIPGLIYCALQAVQMFHTKAKIYELKARCPTKKRG